MRPAEPCRDEERLSGAYGFLEQRDGLARNKSVPRVLVLRAQHDAPAALFAQDLFLRRTFRRLLFANVDVPRARILEFVSGVKNLPHLDRAVALLAKTLRQKHRV